MNTVKGRYPLGDTISAARFWVPREGEITNLQDADGKAIPIYGNWVPRPDRNFGTLQNYAWLGFLGLDHFYLRSPGTGIAKLLTLGGFGFWWLWDILQVWTEEERVLNYGLSTPFDAQIGIGQGMLYRGQAKDWKYEQDTDFGTWALATMIGFTGADMFVLGRFWLGFRKLVIFLITVSALINIGSVGFFGMFWDVFIFMLAIGVLIIWMGDVSMLFKHPDKIMKNGLPISQTAVDSLGWIKKLYLDEDNKVIKGLENEWDTIKDHYMFNKQGVLAQELRGRFWIAHEGEHPQSPLTSSPAGIIPLTIGWRIMSHFFDWIISFTPWGTARAAAKGFAEGGLEGALSAAGASATHGLISKKQMKSVVKAGEGVVDVVDAAGQAIAPIAAFAGPEATAALAALHAGNRALHGAPIGDILKEAAVSSMPIPGGAGGLLNGVGGKGLVGTLTHAAEDAVGEAVTQARQATVDQVKQSATNVKDATIQVAGARREHLSTEAQVMGAAIVALIAGGSLKGLVDYLMPE